MDPMKKITDGHTTKNSMFCSGVIGCFVPSTLLFSQGCAYLRLHEAMRENILVSMLFFIPMALCIAYIFYCAVRGFAIKSRFKFDPAGPASPRIMAAFNVLAALGMLATFLTLDGAYSYYFPAVFTSVVLLAFGYYNTKAYLDTAKLRLLGASLISMLFLTLGAAFGSFYFMGTLDPNSALMGRVEAAILESAEYVPGYERAKKSGPVGLTAYGFNTGLNIMGCVGKGHVNMEFEKTGNGNYRVTSGEIKFYDGSK